jgi:hypothetical protein
MLEQIRSMLLSSTGFCDVRPKRDHQLVGDTPKDEQVNLTQEVRKIFMCLVISNSLVWSTQPSRVVLIAKIRFLI